MAEKKTPATAPEAPAEERVTIKIPFDPTNPKAGDVTVGLNGKMYKIKRGVAVDVPPGVAEILEHAATEERRQFEYINALSKE